MSTSVISRLALVVALALSCAAYADAAPSIVRQACVASGTTLTLPAAPANGDTVAATAISTSATTGATFTDSNSVAYTLQESTSSSAPSYTALWDKVVSGSPTATYTYGGVVNGAYGCAYEINGIVYPGNYQVAQTATSGTTLTVTIAGVKAGDIIIFNSYASDNQTATPTSNNGTITADVACVANIADCAGHFTATSTASTTITLTIATAGAGASIVMADYSATGGSPASGTPVMPGAGVYPGGYPPYYSYKLPELWTM